MRTPRLTSYSPKANANMLTLGEGTLSIEIYYSYQTIVAFSTPDTGVVCCENIWTRTTGAHLSSIEPDPKKRVKADVFREKLDEALSKFIIQEATSAVAGEEVLTDPRIV